MRRVVAFAEGRDDVMFVTFTDLIDDWRGVRAKDRGHAPRASRAGTNAAAIDAFLEPGLRNQTADGASIDALPAPASRQVRALYRACLARVARRRAAVRTRAPRAADASRSPRARRAGDDARLRAVHREQRHPRAGADAVREHPPLLAAAIATRRSSRSRRGPGSAWTPTRARGCASSASSTSTSRSTRAALDYPPANRVFAGRVRGAPRGTTSSP
jgi:hypothetical protein